MEITFIEGKFDSKTGMITTMLGGSPAEAIILIGCIINNFSQETGVAHSKILKDIGSMLADADNEAIKNMKRVKYGDKESENPLQ